MKSKDDAHWSSIARVWVGVIGIIVAVVFGVLELKKKKDRPGRGANGKRNAIEQRGGLRSTPREAAAKAGGEAATEAGETSPEEAAVTE